MKNKICKWTADKDSYCGHETGCKNTFIISDWDDSYDLSEFKFCIYCGSKIEWIMQVEEESDICDHFNKTD